MCIYPLRLTPAVITLSATRQNKRGIGLGVNWFM